MSSQQAGGEQSVAGDFYGVMLKWRATGADPRIGEWLEAQSLTTKSVKAGFEDRVAADGLGNTESSKRFF